jgi:hypothetical protein
VLIEVAGDMAETPSTTLVTLQLPTHASVAVHTSFAAELFE